MTDRPTDFRRIFIQCTGCALQSLILLTGVGSMTAGVVAAEEDSPVASAAARPVPTPAVTNPLPPVINARPAAPLRRDVLPYLRGRGLDWDVPLDVDARDPNLRFLLMAPSRPLLISCDVFIDGEPFRSVREATIAAALAMKSTDQAPANVTEQLRQYVAAKKGQLEAAEARWLLAQWTPGPALLQLQPGFAQERAEEMPLCWAVDTDQSGAIETMERQQAMETVAACDIDQDEVVTLAELYRNRPQGTTFQAWQPLALTAMLADERKHSKLARSLNRLYPDSTSLSALGLESGGTMTAQEIKQLVSRPADFELRVNLNSDDGSSSIELTKVADPSFNADRLFVHPRTIGVHAGGALLELCAVQSTDPGDQVSFGAVVDGFPLLRRLDGNGDQNLSKREIRNLPALLDTLDADSNGIIESHELRPAICLAFGARASVHLALKTPEVGVVPPISQPPPAWFTRMDRNRDGDLTPQEFLGTNEQFKSFDTNGDGFIGSSEIQNSPSNADGDHGHDE